VGGEEGREREKRGEDWGGGSKVNGGGGGGNRGDVRRGWKDGEKRKRWTTGKEGGPRRKRGERQPGKVVSGGRRGV